MWTSIDLRVAQADTVVIGYVVVAGKPSGNQDANDRHQPFVLAVDQTLKGRASQRLSLVAEYDVFRDMDRAGLLCEGCANPPVKLLVMLTHPSGVARTGVVILRPDVFDINAGLEILTGREDLLKAVREEIKREHGVIDQVKALSWTQPLLLAGTHFAPYTVYVPLDARAEQIAHRVLERYKPDPATSDFAADNWREAIKALQSFKSPQNIQLVQQFLDDPYSVETNRGKFYPLRFAAKQVLSSWGADPIPPRRTNSVDKER